jgi:hypothetical protein
MNGQQLDDESRPGVIDKSSEQEIAQLYQIKALYDLTTQISKACFDPCLPKINPRLEDSERACMANCAANFLKLKLLYTKKLIESAKTMQLNNLNENVTD